MYNIVASICEHQMPQYRRFRWLQMIVPVSSWRFVLASLFSWSFVRFLHQYCCAGRAGRRSRMDVFALRKGFGNGWWYICLCGWCIPALRSYIIDIRRKSAFFDRWNRIFLRITASVSNAAVCSVSRSHCRRAALVALMCLTEHLNAFLPPELFRIIKWGPPITVFRIWNVELHLFPIKDSKIAQTSVTASSERRFN